MWPFKKRTPYVPTGRVGITTMTYYGTGLLNRNQKGKAQIKVEELQQRGSLSRIKVLKVSGVDPFDVTELRALVPEYVKTSDVVWFGEENL